jgi:hypothetical protein
MIFRKLINYRSFPQLYSFSEDKKSEASKYSQFPIEDYDLGQRLDRYLKNTQIGWVSAQKYLRNHDIYVQRKDGTRISNNNHRF